MLFTILFTPRV